MAFFSACYVAPQCGSVSAESNIRFSMLGIKTRSQHNLRIVSNLEWTIHKAEWPFTMYAPLPGSVEPSLIYLFASRNLQSSSSMRTFATCTVVIFTTCTSPFSATCIHMLTLDIQTRNQIQSIRRYGDRTGKYRSIFPSNIHCHVRLVWRIIFDGAWVLTKISIGAPPNVFFSDLRDVRLGDGIKTIVQPLS